MLLRSWKKIWQRRDDFSRRINNKQSILTSTRKTWKLSAIVFHVKIIIIRSLFCAAHSAPDQSVCLPHLPDWISGWAGTHYFYCTRNFECVRRFANTCRFSASKCALAANWIEASAAVCNNHPWATLLHFPAFKTQEPEWKNFRRRNLPSAREMSETGIYMAECICVQERSCSIIIKKAMEYLHPRRMQVEAIGFGISRQYFNRRHAKRQTVLQ